MLTKRLIRILLENDAVVHCLALEAENGKQYLCMLTDMSKEGSVDTFLCTEFVDNGENWEELLDDGHNVFELSEEFFEMTVDWSEEKPDPLENRELVKIPRLNRETVEAIEAMYPHYFLGGK